MRVAPAAVAMMFIQEVGFDVVALWSQMGYLAKGTLLLIALAPVFLVGLLVWWITKRRDNAAKGSHR